MTQDDRGWGKLLKFMFSGAPGSFVLWGILVYGVWATFYTNWRDHDGGAPWHFRSRRDK
ncbi:hypothetical protein [Lutimaribacter saemankumensis]|uniref:Uncharacterized protein n=1 Tax=Lutimaribacter saemankumensis TaxID=490829 RepID=A0A1G8QT28_9RHOB|nr:hypothetical protein [Lutimaribacter saemankumensis]SDJ07856.1 hypothetical protein SAMN05421850_10881 [Lutimaribacter saemankumensis]